MPFCGAHWCVCRPGALLSMFQLRFDCGTISLLYFPARRSYNMRLEIPGCDDGVLEDRRRAKLPRGKRLVAGFEDFQNSERRMILAFTGLASTRSCFEATAEEWRLQDETCHACSSKVSRPCNLAAPQNHTLIVSHAACEP